MDVSTSYQAKIEEAENEKLQKQQKGTIKAKTRLSKPKTTLNPFFQVMRGDCVPFSQKRITEVFSKNEENCGEADDEIFCLPCDIQNEVSFALLHLI